MRGQFYDIVPFWTTEPTVRKVYKVNIPMEKEMQFQFYQGECTSSMRYEDGRKAYTFVSTDIMPTRREPNMVDLFDAAALLGYEAEGLCLGMQVENPSPAVVTVGLTPKVDAALPLLVETVAGELARLGSPLRARA